MAADCEKTAQEMREKMEEDGAYFRFSVEQGLQEHHGADLDRESWVNAQTLAYLDDRDTSCLLDQCTDGICRRQGLLALEDLRARVRSKVTHRSSCDGDVAFSNFMEIFRGDTTDVLEMVIVGCNALKHVVDVAKVRRDPITRCSVSDVMQGIERSDEDWKSFRQKLTYHVATLNNHREKLDKDRKAELDTLDPERVCLNPLHTYVESVEFLRHRSRH
jgi:hypothetical protein